MQAPGRKCLNVLSSQLFDPHAKKTLVTRKLKYIHNFEIIFVYHLRKSLWRGSSCVLAHHYHTIIG